MRLKNKLLLNKFSVNREFVFARGLQRSNLLDCHTPMKSNEVSNDNKSLIQKVLYHYWFNGIMEIPKSKTCRFVISNEYEKSYFQ